MNNNIWKKYDIWLGAGVFMMIVSALLYFVVLPIKQEITANSDSFKKNKIDNEVDVARISKIPDMEKVHTSIFEKLNELDIILDKNNELDLIKMLEYLAAQTGNEISLRMEYVSPDDKISKTVTSSPDKLKGDVEKIEVFNINRLIVHIGLTGKYDQLFNFLNKLENMQYAVNVTALDLKKEMVDGGNQDSVNSISNSFVTDVVVEKDGDKIKKDILKSKIDAVVYLKN